MMRWVIIFFAFSPAAFGQQLIEGKIVDVETEKPIPFASIGIIGTSRGTSSNLNGEFTLSIPASASLKITCVGYESIEIKATSNLMVRMKPIATLLNAVVVFNKTVNPRRIVQKAFASVRQNYAQQPFMQKFFYRHYCKDDSVYGRLIEAFVDVWKDEGYHSIQKSAGSKEEIRVTQLRRSLDKTAFAQGHEPISIENILQADIVAYQAPLRSEHISFYSDVSNLKTDLEDYTFTFEGITTYDGKEVYEISYQYKKDSALTTSGQYLQLTHVTGSLFITTDTHAFIKIEEVKKFGENIIRSSAYYRKHDGRYYTYHLMRDGENRLADNGIHCFHIDLTSIETDTDVNKKFAGHVPGKAELSMIPYDSVFWNNSSVLKTTPLEDKIIRDLGDGLSLSEQFCLYRQYETNMSDGGKNGAEKFNWFKKISKGKRSLYLVFWRSDCKSYLTELERAKQLNRRFRNMVSFIFLSLDNDQVQWEQAVSKYNLGADGIINYRIGSSSDLLTHFNINETPAFISILQSGEENLNVKRPSDPALEKELTHN